MSHVVSCWFGWLVRYGWYGRWWFLTCWSLVGHLLVAIWFPIHSTVFGPNLNQLLAIPGRIPIPKKQTRVVGPVVEQFAVEPSRLLKQSDPLRGVTGKVRTFGDELIRPG